MNSAISALAVSVCIGVLAASVLALTMNDVRAQAVGRSEQPPLSPGVIRRLERATWIRDARTKPNARAVYVFTDPECGYCNQLWKDIQASKVLGAEVRYVLVGVITPNSIPKAAAILQAASPSDALAKHEGRFANGGVAPAPTVSDASSETLNINASLMSALGIEATPAIVYEDARKETHLFYGVPSADELRDILNPKS